MEQLKVIPFIFLMIGISAIIGGAMAIVLAQFASTTTDTDALNVISNGTEGVRTIAEQLSTVAIIGIMVIIIGMISSVFVYFKYFY